MTEKKGTIRKALFAAFPHTTPILAGFLVLGMSYGVYARASGLGFWTPVCMAVVVFGGSLEFVAVSMLVSAFAPVQTFLMALMIQARHLFYGISMLERYKDKGWKKVYLIYALCDETFSINCAVRPPEGVDEGWFMFFVSLLDQCYWLTGTAIGAAMGGVLPFSTEGMDFAMTALFVVIFLDQWRKEKRHWTALIGVLSAAGCLLVFGADGFLIPTMACILVFLTGFRKPIERGLD